MIERDSQGLPILPVPEDPRQERILAMLLGETDPAETAAIQAEIAADPNLAALRDQLEQATNSLHTVYTDPEHELSNLPDDLTFSDQQRQAFIQQLNAPSIQPRRRGNLIPFSHPLVGIGVAACFLFVFFLGYLPTGGLQQHRPAKVLLQPAHEPRENAPTHDFDIYIAPPEEESSDPPPPPLTLNRLEMSISPERLGTERQQRRLEQPRPELTVQAPKYSPAQLSDRLALGDGNQLRVDLQDVGSSISIVTDEFLVETSPTDGATDFQYASGRGIGGDLQSDHSTTSASVFSRDNENIGETVHISQPQSSLFLQSRDTVQPQPAPPPASLAETPRFAANHSSEEEIFELSPFEVHADGQGYRATNTLAGSRINTAVVNTDPTQYTFFSAAELKDTQSSKRKSASRSSERARVPFSRNTATRETSLSKSAPQDTSATAASRLPETNFTLIDGLLSSESASLDRAEQKEAVSAPSVDAEADLESQPTNPVANPTLNEYPEITTSEDPLSTFSLNVSDVSYRLAESYLAQNTLPPPATLRAEEFINAFDYGDATPTTEQKIGFAWEHARWPFSLDREVLRVSLKTAASGRGATQPLNLVIAIDTSGSMSRPDRVEIIKTALAALGEHLTERDRVSIVTFDREARLQAEVASPESLSLHSFVTALNPQGGTDLESGLNLAYQVAARAYNENAINRVILLTDGAANLGNIQAEALQATVEQNRRQGIALDCFGIGFDGHNDAFLEQLSRNGDGRYRFLNDPENARSELGQKLAGQLRPAVYDVKVQVEFNPDRVTLHQQLGYQQHRLKHEDFRDNTVDAAELGAAEAGVAVYIAKVDPNGRGDLGLVRARFRDAATGAYKELSWNLPYEPKLPMLEEASPKLRLAAVAAAFAAKLNQSPFAETYEYGQLFELARDLPQQFPSQQRAQTLPQQILKATTLTPAQ